MTPCRLADGRAASTAERTTSSTAIGPTSRRSTPALICDISKRSSIIDASLNVSPRMSWAYCLTSSGVETTPSSSASVMACTPAIGVRRSWLSQASSSRRDRSALRSRSSASRSHTILRASERPRRIALGTLTAVTASQTRAVRRSSAVNMNWLVPTTPTMIAISGTRVSRTIDVASARVRSWRRMTAPIATTPSDVIRPMMMECRSAELMRGVPSIAESVDRDEALRVCGHVLDLVAQSFDVDRDGRVVAELPAPHLLEQVVAAEHLVRVAQEELQQVELARRQRQRLVALARLAGHRVERQVSVDQHAFDRGGAWRAGAPSRCASVSSLTLNGLAT